jgi:hypothetical protein
MVSNIILDLPPLMGLLGRLGVASLGKAFFCESCQ